MPPGGQEPTQEACILDELRATLFPWLIGGLFVGNLVLVAVRGHLESRRREQREREAQWEERRRRWRGALGPSEPAPPATALPAGTRTQQAKQALADAHTRWEQAHARADGVLRTASDHESSGATDEAIALLTDEGPLEALASAREALHAARVPVERAVQVLERRAAQDLPEAQLASAREALGTARLPTQWLTSHPLQPDPVEIHGGLDALRAHDPLAYLTAVEALRGKLLDWRKRHGTVIDAGVTATRLWEEVEPLVATLPDAEPPEDPRLAWAEAREQLAVAHRQAQAGELSAARRSFELAGAALREVRMLVPVVLKAPERAPRAVDALQRQVDSQRQALQSALTSLRSWLGNEVDQLPLLVLTEQRQAEAEAGIATAAEVLEAGDPWGSMRWVRTVEAVPTEPLTALRTLVADLRFLERFQEQPERRDQRMRAARTRAVSAIKRGEADPDEVLSVGDALREASPEQALVHWAGAWAAHRSAWHTKTRHQRLVRARAHRRQAPARSAKALAPLPEWPY